MATKKEVLVAVISKVEDGELYRVQQELEARNDTEKVRRLQRIRRDLRHLAQEIRLGITA